MIHALIGHLTCAEARCGPLAVDALGVDTQQDVDAVAGPFGDLGRVHAGVEPERYRRVPEVVRPGSER